jgi:hypothetical protein
VGFGLNDYFGNMENNMTERHIAYTVTLKEPIREDDSENIINAIKMIKNVRSVVPEVEDVHDYWTKENVKFEIMQKLINIVQNNK